VSTLRIGDTVIWRGGHGRHAPLPAIVTGFFSELRDPWHADFNEFGPAICCPWDYLAESAYRGVFLSIGVWAYGYQIEQADKGKAPPASTDEAPVQVTQEVPRA
jgi:hypothetical protein